MTKLILPTWQTLDSIFTLISKDYQNEVKSLQSDMCRLTKWKVMLTMVSYHSAFHFLDPEGLVNEDRNILYVGNHKHVNSSLDTGDICMTEASGNRHEPLLAFRRREGQWRTGHTVSISQAKKNGS